MIVAVSEPLPAPAWGRSAWQPPLPAGEVRVWLARLDRVPGRERLARLLSGEDRTRTEARLEGRGDWLAALGEPAGRQWSIRALALGSDYVGAVAAEGPGWRLRCRSW